MYGLALLCVALVAGGGGWLIGRLKTQRRWPLILWVPLPLWLCLPLSLPAGIFGGMPGLFTWFVVVAMLGYPMAAWIIAAGLGVLLARRPRIRSVP